MSRTGPGWGRRRSLQVQAQMGNLARATLSLSLSFFVLSLHFQWVTAKTSRLPLTRLVPFVPSWQMAHQMVQEPWPNTTVFVAISHQNQQKFVIVERFAVAVFADRI